MAAEAAIAAPRRLPVLSVFAGSWVIGLLCLALLIQGESAGWLLIAVSYLLILALTPAPEDIHLRRALLVTVTLHHLVSLTNYYGFTVLSAEADAGTFHRSAARSAGLSRSLFDWSGQLGSVFYLWFLSKWYVLFGADLLVGQTAGILAFLGFSVLVYRSGLLVGLDERQAAGATLLTGLWPAMVMFTSVTLRESWKCLFVALHVYAAIRYFEKPSNLLFFFLWGLSGLALMMLHTAYGPLLPILLVLPFLFLAPISAAKQSPTLRILLLVAAFGVSLWWMQSPLGVQNRWVDTLLSGEIVDEAEYARSRAVFNVGRSSYGIPLDTDSIGGLVATTPLIFAAYLASPLPWQIRAPVHVYGAIDALVGLAFLGASLLHYRRTSEPQHKSRMRYLLSVFVAISLVYALGSASHGTAIRHRLQTTWILVIIGYPQVASWLGRLRQRSHVVSRR